MEFRKTQLDNGLTIIAEVNPAAASMAAGYFVRTGSRDETPEVAGVSHFLEHMVFKGTSRRTPLDVNRDFDEMGANYNAFTSEENTVFYAGVLPEFQDRMLDLLGDILRPSLRQDDFDVEKKVILEEIAMYDDMPRYRLYDRLMAEHFAGHPLGHSVLGTRDSITALSRGQMQAYFDRRYAPSNVTLVGVGHLDFDAFVAKARAMCGRWKLGEARRSLPPAPAIVKEKLITDPKVTRQHMGWMSPGPIGANGERFPAMLVSTILGDSTGSRLYYALVDTALADEASMSYDSLDGAGAFITFVSTDAEKSAQVAGIVREEFRKFLEDGPTDAEMTAAKNKISSGATLKGELPMGRLTAVGFDWLYRHEYIKLSEQIDRLFATGPDEVLAVARKYDLLQTTLVGLGPLEKL